MNRKRVPYDPRTPEKKQLDEAIAAGDWTGFESEELVIREATAVHERGLSTATQIARFQMDEIIAPQQVIAILNQAKVPFVLVGAYGLAGWMNPRATQDVDVVVGAEAGEKSRETAS